MTSDAAGRLYVIWNSGIVDGGQERIFFSTSADHGSTWSPKADVSLAPSGVDHAFPSVTAGAAGDIRIAWMDQRDEPNWNVYYRSSTNGGSALVARKGVVDLCGWLQLHLYRWLPLSLWRLLRHGHRQPISHPD